jgi:hypothetical protein
LSGKTIYLSAGHGWQWNGYGWRAQRPPYPDASTGYVGPIIEDHNNAEVVNQYLLRYLQNAGADVWTVRERDLGDFEQIVDDGSPGFSASEGWGAVDARGYLTRYLTATTSLTPTAAVTWTTAPLPTDGHHALYVWYVPGADRASDAHYTVHHAGGTTELSVDQRHHGYTWRYVGSFAVRAGERLTVNLNNQSATPGQIVVADAIRFGGGQFDDADLASEGGPVQTSAPYAPDEPWWETAAYYHTQRLGMDLDDYAYFNDVIARPLWARWEHAYTGDDAIYISWHTNGYNGHNTSVWGTVSYIHSFQPVTGSADLRRAIHDELINDARAGWDPAWRDLGVASKDLGELRELWDENDAIAIPGVLLEIAYHDHAGDTNALKDPRFALLSSRAVYQGIAAYFEARDGTDLTLLPEPPTHLTVRNDGPGRVTLNWRPPPTDSLGLLGDAAESYRVYTSRDGLGWDDGQPVPSTTHTLTDLGENELVFLRVSAVNAGGESLPTPVLAARVAPRASGIGQILLVDGFDRIDRHGLIIEDDPTEGVNARLFPGQINSFDYVIEHGETILLPFDSALNEAVADGDLNLSLYSIVDWILGEESSIDRTFDDAEQTALAAYLDGGGALFVSGAEIGWDLVARGNGPDFYRTYLGADLAADDAGVYLVTPTVEGIFAGLGAIEFRDNYDADYPDQLTPLSGSVAALDYAGENGVAAVQYDAGDCRRVVYLGFPFETIAATQRPPVMARVLDYLSAGGCLGVAPQTAITTPVSGRAFSVVPDFGGTATGSNPIQRVEVRIGGPDGRYWDGQGWITASRWLTALGTTVWRYELPPYIGSGSMTLVLPDGPYHLWARAWDSVALSDTTPAVSHFMYDTLPPTIGEPMWPTEGLMLTTAPDHFAWWGAPDDGGAALAYRLQVAGQTYTTSGVIQEGSGSLQVPLVVYTPTTPLSLGNGTYTWRVQAFDAAGNRSPWTTPQTFVVGRHGLYLPLVQKDYVGLEPGTNLIVNGGFETDQGWDMTATGYPASYVTDPVRSGQRAGRAWVPKGWVAYSSLAQTVTLPSQHSLVLSYWFYPTFEDDDAGDAQYVSLTDTSGTGHLLWLGRQNDREWLEMELDLTPYRGQTVILRFGGRNDGDDATATLVIDDVRLDAFGR